jgi:hypothetical protein
MNLTPSERAAMVKDLEMLSRTYADWSIMARASKEKIRHYEKMMNNYSALASALKEGLNFKAVA